MWVWNLVFVMNWGRGDAGLENGVQRGIFGSSGRMGKTV
jgi:hypothetical protein